MFGRKVSVSLLLGVVTQELLAIFHDSLSNGLLVMFAVVISGLQAYCLNLGTLINIAEWKGCQLARILVSFELSFLLAIICNCLII